MRLIELKRAIDKSHQLFNYKLDNANGYYYVSNVINLKSAILELYSIKFFNEDERRILLPIVNSMGDRISYNDPNLYNTLAKLLSGIKWTIGFLYDWFQIYMPDSFDDGDSIINIKLPEIQNFSDLEFISKKLDGSFTTVINEISGSKIQIKQFDHGSFWIILSVGVPLAVSVIAGIAWSAAVVAKKWNEAMMARKEVEKAGLQNEAIEQLVAYQKMEMNNLATAEAENIENKCFSEHDNERVQRIREAIKDISELIIKGVQIQSALSAPEEVSNLFPNYNMLSFIESTIKKIGK